MLRHQLQAVHELGHVALVIEEAGPPDSVRLQPDGETKDWCNGASLVNSHVKLHLE